MTNLGFRMAMEERGIRVKETPVGDRHVLAALDEGGLSLGGEQSGHIIFRRLATTGDGLLTGLVLADLVARSGRPLADLLDGLVTPVPQVLVNVPVPNTELLASAEAVWSAVAQEEAGSATPGGSCSGRAGPSRWCGSWWRRAVKGWPRRSPSGSAHWSGFELRAAATARLTAHGRLDWPSPEGLPGRGGAGAAGPGTLAGAGQ